MCDEVESYSLKTLTGWALARTSLNKLQLYLAGLNDAEPGKKRLLVVEFECVRDGLRQVCRSAGLFHLASVWLSSHHPSRPTDGRE